MSVGPPGTAESAFSLLHRTFGDETMANVWSEVATVESWLRAEAGLARSQAAIGELQPERAEAIVTVCTIDHIDLPRLWAGSTNVGYPILPLVRQLTDALPEGQRGSVHYGATTQDIMDTGLSLQMASSVARLVALVDRLGEGLASLIEDHAHTVMAGRTHGQQAVPTTFGAKLATYLRQMHRLRLDLDRLPERCCLVSLHGAAGTSAGLGPKASEMRSAFANELGLGVPDGPWHVTRDGLAEFVAVCARGAAASARLAREVVDLSRTEIGELAEAGGHHRGASSTMPQKANPISSEAVIGMSAIVAALAGTSYRAMEAGHERSAGEWQSEWHAVPQVAVLSAGCLATSVGTVEGLAVYPERMQQNLDAEQGRTLAEAYMFQLARKLGREIAHDRVYDAALRSKQDGAELYEVLRTSAQDLERIDKLSAADHLGQAVEDAHAAVQDWRSLRKATYRPRSSDQPQPPRT